MVKFRKLVHKTLYCPIFKIKNKYLRLYSQIIRLLTDFSKVKADTGIYDSCIK